MNSAEFRASLEAQGMSPIIVDAMVKQFDKASQPKPERKKKGGWFPGMPSTSNYVEAEVEVTTTCHVCNDVTTKVITMKVKADSPRTQQLGVSMCSKCPEYLLGMTPEALVSLVLLKCHPAPSLNKLTTRHQIKMAKTLSPEKVLGLIVKP